MPDLQHRENFCMTELAAVIYVWLGRILSFFWQQYFDSFGGKLPLPSHSQSSRLGWVWPHFLVPKGRSVWLGPGQSGHSIPLATVIGSGMDMWPELVQTMNPENFFQNYWTMGPVFLSRVTRLVGSKSGAAPDIFSKMRWWEMLGGSAETEVNK